MNKHHNGIGGFVRALPFAVLLPFSVSAQNNESTAAVEEIIVTGTYIKGLSEETLPVTVMNEEAITNLGAVNMLDILAYIPSIGDFEFDDTNTGTNGARGDVAGINMRGIGSGNTLVLINGRRMVTHPTYQAINNVPVTFYNVNSIPSPAVQRIEVLRDGASATYGADASAGVVNIITKTEEDGFSLSGKYGASSETSYDETELTASGGWSFNGDATHLGVFGSYYERSQVHQNELGELFFELDRRGSMELPEEWRNDSQLNNTSSLTPWARVSVGALNAQGRFIGVTRHVDPTTGLLVAGAGSERYNFNEDQKATPGVDRLNFMALLTHDLANGMEIFGDATYYQSTSNTYRAASPLDDSLAFLIVPPTSYYNPTGQEVLILGWRPVDLGPRVIEVDQDEYRLMGGLRGNFGSDWEWESALLYSQAEATDSEGNRQAKSLFTTQLMVNGPDALNPFAGPGGNTQAALDGIRITSTDVRTSRLTLWDFHLNKTELFSAPGGPVGFATGVEWRNEYYKDDRDPRLDGSQPFDNGAIFDESDVIGVSATFDSDASRDTFSVYGEFFVPLVGDANAMAFTKALEFQLAGRYENTSDFGSTAKPKVALRWEPLNGFSLRASYAEGFRAPNLPQMNQGTIIRRIDGVADPLRSDVTGLPIDTGQTYRVTTRIANEDLDPEDTETVMYGFVIAPKDGPLSGFTATVDWWNIKQEGVVGLLDPSDSLDLDVLLRSQGSFNPDVVRDPVNAQDQAYFDAWNLANPNDQRTAVGVATNIVNEYENFEPREISGWDASVQYTTPDTAAGSFRFRVDTTKITSFEQQGVATTDLVRQNGNPEWRTTAGVNWAFRSFDASVTMRYISDVYDTSLYATGTDFSGTYNPVLNRTYWDVDSWTVYNLGLAYDFSGMNNWAQGITLNAGVRNLFNEQAPFADESPGYFSSLHNTYGRVMWGQVTFRF